MAENDFSQSLSETVSRLMESPEVAEIMSSLKGSAEEHEKNGDQSAQPLGGISLPPDIMEKLPSMISALSGMGIGGAPRQTEQRTESVAVNTTQKRAGDKQRKALLSSLRPYLNPHRQNIIDNMLRIEGLAGLLSTVGTSGANTDSERR